MLQPETFAIVEEDFLTRPNVACCKDANPVPSCFWANVGLVSRSKSCIGFKSRSFGVVYVTALEVTRILSIQV